ncbi:zinc finger matrin-type protein 1 [Esox lucius]|uniref:C2H2-type domain-containing protein n=1 Tax=Esox lucius TaxID=8010 RepID=A0AAY5JZK4_ESOLU|nr:zinc finger matrin-type protein 1 [Esox lucius]
MEEQSICAPLLAESDTKNNNNSHYNVASVSDADTVINTNNTNSSQIEGPRKSHPLKGLLTDSRCHVCEASLLFESQRVAHYEGKKHAQKVRLYLQAKKDEKLSKDPGGFQRGVPVHKDRFCELCSMVFSSPVVARSHYDGKVHAKNLRKQGVHPAAQTKDGCLRGPESTSPRPPQASGSDQGAGEAVGTAPADAPVRGVDLSDPDKHCRLCAASFNNPYMAQQHYVGRKHQRNHARQQLLKDLGGDPARATSFTCPVCNIELNSVEMYQSHMQGNKHQIKEKKVVDLCKSQKKVYDSFAEELADYIHVQKARGIAPNTSFGIMKGEQEGEGVANPSKTDGQNKTNSSLPPSSRPLLPVIPPPQPAPEFYPPHIWSPPYQAPPIQFGFRGNMYEQKTWGHTFPQPLPPGSTLTGLIGRPQPRGRADERSSSSASYTTSSPSCTSSSDSDCDHHYRERKRRKMRKERRAREEDSGDRKRRRGRRGGNNTEGRGGREPDVEEERGRRRRKRQHRRSRSHGEGSRAKRRKEGESEGAKEDKELNTEERVGGEGEETEVYMQAEIQEGTKESYEVRETRAKHRKDKKRMKEKVDTRTEEEKLWDESIIGL